MCDEAGGRVSPLSPGFSFCNHLSIIWDIPFPSLALPSRLNKIVYFESRKRELKKRRKNEYRCDERLKIEDEESTSLTYTGLHEELEHLKIKTRLISDKPVNVMGEYAI
jgi:hypothetical protein